MSEPEPGPWGACCEAYDDGYKRGYADALEAAAKVNDEQERVAQDYYERDRAHELPMPALRHAARLIRALKPKGAG